ncbi:unnamed protein product [Larinioides sclopetarius]|uniref:E3 ubiquitin-protein ligase CHFR n=1 Tax=Larinioides sclopetarius TaxID=280406 RepID=A0AAV1Z9M5_9ARAC
MSMASTSKTSNEVTGYLKRIIGHPLDELFPLTSDKEVIIGRHKQAVQIWIQDVNISRTHCVLKHRQNGWFIKDLKETIKADDDSQSLLNESKILIDCEPYPFSQPLAIESAQTEQDKSNEKIEKKYSVEEQLEKATLEVKKLKKDKLYLSRLVKDLKSEEFLKRKFQVEFQKMLEDELMCNICTEVFLKAITLGCSHTFCEYCISEWKKKQKKCPICREKITSETKILVLDSFINKAVEQLDIGTQNRRKELTATREKAKATKQKKSKRSRGRNRRVQNESSDSNEIRQIRGESSNSIGVQIRFSRHNSPSIQVLQDDEFMDLTSDFSDLSDENDSSVEGYGYFGGYGRCYSCGRRGHWANGCPYM